MSLVGWRCVSQSSPAGQIMRRSMSEAPPRPFVVDAVIHAYNFLESNMVSGTADMDEFRTGVFKHHKMFSPLDERFHLTSAEFIDDLAPETLAHAVFAESQADMAV